MIKDLGADHVSVVAVNTGPSGLRMGRLPSHLNVGEALHADLVLVAPLISQLRETFGHPKRGGGWQIEVLVRDATGMEHVADLQVPDYEVHT